MFTPEAVKGRAGMGRHESTEAELSAAEVELLHELVSSLRSIRYGSVSLTVHDGRVVEIQKVEKIRRSLPERKE